MRDVNTEDPSYADKDEEWQEHFLICRGKC